MPLAPCFLRAISITLMWVILAMPFQGMLAHKFGSQQTDAAALIAMAVAAALLVSVVMPSEYGIGPPGVGSALGLKEMGEIRSEEHTSDLQSLMRNSNDVFCLKKQKKKQ